MVYSNKFVMCVLLNGVPQSEAANGQITLPFGAEYVLRFKNKHNRRAMVKIFIDGENVSGNGYIIDAHGSVDIKRHHDVDRAFRFVALDSPAAIEEGKNGPNPDKIKGTIEARFWLEKERPVYRPAVIREEHHHHHYYEKKRKFEDPPSPWNPYPQPWINPSPYPSPYPTHPPIWCSNDTKGMTYGGGTTGRGMSSGMHVSGMSFNNADTEGVKATWNCQTDLEKIEDLKFQCLSQNPTLLGVPAQQPPILQEGCTVEGGSTGQSFYTVSFEAETDYVSIKVFLVGYVPTTPVANPAPVVLNEGTCEQGEYCTNCGAKKAKKKAKFCHNCGAKL